MTHSREYLKQLFRDFKKRLTEMNMTQEEAANEFEITRSHLNKVLNGRADASLSLIEQIENFTYGNNPEYDKIYIKTDPISKEYLNFMARYSKETMYAMKELQEEYSFKIYIYLFTKLYCPSEDEDESFSLEELADYLKCKIEDLYPSLDELVEKKFLIQKFNENNEVEEFGFDIYPSKE